MSDAQGADGSISAGEPRPDNPLDYATPRAQPPAAQARWLPDWLAAGLILLQVVWLIPTAFLSIAVACDTNGAPIPMFLVTCFAILPSAGAVVAGIAAIGRARKAGLKVHNGVLAAVGLSGCWIGLCVVEYVHFLFTRSPNDIYCP